MPYEEDLKHPFLKGQFPCSACQKTFYHSSSLNRHIMPVHFKCYICKICNANIESNDALRIHMMEVHNIASKIVTCRCCNWAFSDKTTLRVHQQNLQQNKDSGEDVFVLATCTIEGNPTKKVKEEPCSDDCGDVASQQQSSHSSQPNAPPQTDPQKPLMELLVNSNSAANVPTSTDQPSVGGVPMNVQQAMFANAMWMGQWMRNNAIAAQLLAAAHEARQRTVETGMSGMFVHANAALSDAAEVEAHSEKIEGVGTNANGGLQSDKENLVGFSPTAPPSKRSKPTSKLSAVIDRLKSSPDHVDADTTDISNSRPLDLTKHAEIVVKDEPTTCFESASSEDTSDCSFATSESDSSKPTCGCLALMHELEMDLDHVRSASTGATANVVEAANTQVISDRLVLVRLEHAGHLAERALQLIPTSAPVGLYEAVANLIRITRPKTASLAVALMNEAEFYGIPRLMKLLEAERYVASVYICSIMEPSNKDESGAYLIDRSPEYMNTILNYLNSGQGR